MNYQLKDFEKMMSDNNGTLDISNTRITRLPKNLIVRGDLILNKYILSLPYNLTIFGNLDMRNSTMQSIDADYLTVHGNIFMGPMIECINKTFIVDGDVDARQSPLLRELPEMFGIGGNLYINSKYFKSFSTYACICGDLCLSNSGIEELPNTRICGGSIDISNTPIKKLPDDFVVYGNLNISSTNIKDFPNKMVILGNLDMRNTSITNIPNDVYIIGDRITDTGVIKYN